MHGKKELLAQCLAAGRITLEAALPHAVDLLYDDMRRHAPALGKFVDEPHLQRARVWAVLGLLPAVLLIGVVIGWVLGSRAAQDAMASELRKRERKLQK